MELKHNLKIEPYPYQREGIIFGLDKHRLLIGDEPGLGKTLQSIGIVDTANAYPALVICPSSLKINWQREFEKFFARLSLTKATVSKTQAHSRQSSHGALLRARTSVFSFRVRLLSIVQKIWFPNSPSWAGYRSLEVVASSSLTMEKMTTLKNCLSNSTAAA